jgi:hypothetical protein
MPIRTVEAIDEVKAHHHTTRTNLEESLDLVDDRLSTSGRSKAELKRSKQPREGAWGKETKR